MIRAAWMRPVLLAAALVSPLALVPATVHAQPKGNKSAASSDEAAAKKATALFVKGNDLYKAKKYSLALDQFKQSYAAVPSPNSHLYIARCLAGLGDLRAAYLEFNKVVEEATARAATEEKYAPTRDTAKTERDDLLSKLALVTISVPQGGANASVRIGGEAVPREQWDKPIPVSPGTVEATLQIEGKPDVTEKLTLKGGDKKSVVLNAPGGGGSGDDPTASSPDSSTSPDADTSTPTTAGKRNPLRIAAFVAGGVGVVGMGMFTAFGALSLSAHSDLTKKCGNRPCDPAFADEVSSGKTKQTVANVSLVIGAAGLATGATLFILSLRKGKTESAPAARLVLSPSYAGIHGEF